MFGMYQPLWIGNEILPGEVDTGPVTLVRPDERMLQQLGRWQRDLWQAAGVSMRQALPRRRRNLAPSDLTCP